MRSLCLIPFLLVILPNSIHGLIKEHSYEKEPPGGCIKNMIKYKSIPMPPEILAPGSLDYNPMMNYLSMDRKTVAILGISEEEIEESSQYYDSCFRIQILDSSRIKISGYDGRSVEYTMIVDNQNKDPGFRAKIYRNVSASSGLPMDNVVNGEEGGYLTVTYSDGKTFACMAGCTLDNKRLWTLVSTVPALDPKAQAAVKRHVVEDLGFSKHLITTLRYDYCSQSPRP